MAFPLPFSSDVVSGLSFWLANSLSAASSDGPWPSSAVGHRLIVVDVCGSETFPWKKFDDANLFFLLADVVLLEP